MNLNDELVKDGWCWWYRKYAPGDAVLEGLEQEAGQGEKRLWGDPVLIPTGKAAQCSEFVVPVYYIYND